MTRLIQGQQNTIKTIRPNDILDATLEELTAFTYSETFENHEEWLYTLSLIAYLRGKTDDLENILKKMTTNKHMHSITLLRLENRNNQYNEKTVNEVIAIAAGHDWLAAEAQFTIGMTMLRFSKNTKAKEFFKTAYGSLSKIGAHKKSVKALLNIVVAESRINNKKRLFFDYEYVAKAARKYNSYEVEGICLQNISKELHILGAFDKALAYSNRAVSLQKRDAGSLPYFESLLHRCHVYISLGRYSEALADFQESKISNHSQIAEARKAVEILLGEKTSVHLDLLEPAWRSKLIAKDLPVCKTKLEQEFISFIKNKRAKREEIIQHLYGSNIDWTSAKNRFKVFYSRFKSKNPGLLTEEDETIFIVDDNIMKDMNESGEVG